MAAARSAEIGYYRLFGDPDVLQYAAGHVKRTIHQLEDYPSTGRTCYYTKGTSPVFERMMQRMGIHIQPVLAKDSHDIRRVNRAGI